MRVSLGVGFLYAVSIRVGFLVGALAGYAAVWWITCHARWWMLPLSAQLHLFLALMPFWSRAFWNIILILGFFSWRMWHGCARQFRRSKKSDLCWTAHAMACSPRQIGAGAPAAQRAPHCRGGDAGGAIGHPERVALSLHLPGRAAPDASLGNMLEDAKAWMLTAWWMWTVPGVLISIIVLAFNFVGDGLRDAFDPMLYRR